MDDDRDDDDDNDEDDDVVVDDDDDDNDEDENEDDDCGGGGDDDDDDVCLFQVLELCLMLSDGKTMTLTCNDDDKDMFQAACLSLGALGIIVSVKLQCEPAFRLQQITYATKLDDVRSFIILSLLSYDGC